MTTINGIVLGPNSPLAAGVRKCRSEDAEQSLGDDLVARISGKDDGVVEFDQRRAATFLTRGVSDRRYRLLGICLFWEWKAEDGQLTPSQHLFLLRELQFNAYACCGVLEDLEGLIAAVRLEHQTGQPRIRDYCQATIARWAAKGYRPERPPTKRRRRA